MGVSFQNSEDAEAAPKGPRARTTRLMLETAIGLMQKGNTPSVSEVAEAAEVSRATAYRYFPSQSVLVQTVVDEALGPILEWQSPSEDAAERVTDLLNTSMPRIYEFEATFKAALKHSLENWAQGVAGKPDAEPVFARGHRIALLRSAIAPLQDKLSPTQFDRLAQALSLVYGLEVLLVLQDIWRLDFEETTYVAQWAAEALVRAAIEDAAA
ncbi:TetR/AcrR family transcriptional regulator [Devosia sp.]|uniref:TetR/AcrR family transcriptional regulator n=1 Tax=Devosia sp. TaxID=1871048 RepID=UPI00326328B5